MYIYVCVYYTVLVTIYTPMKSVSATVLKNVAHSLEIWKDGLLGFIWVGILSYYVRFIF